MVRQRLIVICCCLVAAMLALPAAAQAAQYNIYDGTMSSTQVQVFRDIISKLSILDDYVVFRSGQYEYVMLAGDLTYEQDFFTAETATEFKLLTHNGYNSQYNLTVQEVTDVVLAPGSTIVYSNLGYFPDLVDPGTKYDFAMLSLGVIALMMFLIRSIFSWTYRGSRR